MADNILTGAVPGDSGASRSGRKSDPAVAIARLQATLDGLQDSFDRALARLDANAERQDTLIAQATVALAEANRILKTCDEANHRIDDLPTQNDYKLLSDRVGTLSTRIDSLDKSESATASIAAALAKLPWWKLVLTVAACILGAIPLLMLLKRVGLI